MSELDKSLNIVRKRDIFVHPGVYTMNLLILHFLQDQELHKIYQGTTPQHMTLAHWFIGDPRLTALAIDKIVSAHSPIAARVGEKAMFGHNQDVPVYRVEPKNVIIGLRKALLTEIRGLQKPIFPDPQWNDDGYNPHVTIHEGHPTITNGDSFEVNSLSLITRTNEHDEKQIIHTAKLANKS